jgi:ankyrin repeat protein
MRLLNTTKRKLEEFRGNKIPLYAILSHTWDEKEKEITFQDIEGHDAEKKVEYEKVRNTCDMAAAHGFDYVWIDTCCIDKTSSAELSEAINSMYRWYQDSGVCYVYLADVPPNAVDHRTRAIGPEFSKARWFTRGWTLQELIAPSTVIFLDQKWQEIGTKSSLQQVISEITGIPTNILLGGNLEGASVAQRMSWASKRKTTRDEDLAYCLMGMFGINMPLLYGEGERAFTRLQEEIMKVSDDHSLFAWKSSEKQGGLLATSPAAFVNSGEVIPFNPSSTLSGAITVNNKGIHLKLHFRTVFQDVGLAILPCIENGKEVAIYLRAMSETKEYFVRALSNRLELLNLKDSSQSEYSEKSICVQQERRIRKNQSLLPRAAADGHEAVVKLLLEKGAELETKDKDSQTPLSCAAEMGHKAVVKLLLEKGAQLETKNKDGYTPLLYATENGHKAVVKLLLEKGAELETQSENGRTPLSCAAEMGHEAVVKLLLEKGAELETKSRDDRKPLLWNPERGSEVTESEYGQTPLMWAAENGHEAVVKLLLEKGAQLETKDEDGHTPLLYATENGHEAVVKLLLEKGAELETKDEDSNYGQMLLSCAARKGYEAVVKLLLEKGAGLETKSRNGQTPLSCAAENGHKAVVKLLLEKGA